MTKLATYLASALLLSATLAIAAPQQAQAQGPVPEATRGGGGEAASSDGVVYKKETSYDFDDDLVEGALVKPDGALVGGELHGKTSSLIQIRRDFIPEMIKSVEDI